MLRTTRASVVIVCLGLAATALPAAAQGTAAQREACMGDALRLCQDYVPDVGKITACMRAHRASLSPKCQTAFNAATGAGPFTAGPTGVAARKVDRTAHRVVAKAVPHGTKTARMSRRSKIVVASAYVGAGGVDTRGLGIGGMRPSGSDMRMARRALGMACGSQYIPAETCGMVRQYIGY